jgi:hypothetical protein
MRPLVSPETEKIDNAVENPGRNGLFPSKDSFAGLGRLSGGGSSHLRTGLQQNSLISGNLLGKSASYRAISRLGRPIFASIQAVKRMNRRYLSGNLLLGIREITLQIQRKCEIAMSTDLEKCDASA